MVHKYKYSQYYFKRILPMSEYSIISSLLLPEHVLILTELTSTSQSLSCQFNISNGRHTRDIAHSILFQTVLLQTTNSEKIPQHVWSLTNTEHHMCESSCVASTSLSITCRCVSPPSSSLSKSPEFDGVVDQSHKQ